MIKAKRWYPTEQEKSQVADLIASGSKVVEVAKAMNKTPEQIKSLCYRYGYRFKVKNIIRTNRPTLENVAIRVAVMRSMKRWDAMRGGTGTMSNLMLEEFDDVLSEAVA